MNEAALAQLLIIASSVLLDTVRCTCSPTEPADCNFQQEHGCGWLGYGGWDIIGNNNHYLRFYGRYRGMMKSGVACSTGRSTHCLTFRYSFQAGFSSDLNVIINNTQAGEEVVWTVSSSSTTWDRARVPINVDGNFSVIFEVRRHEGFVSNPGYVYLDTVDYRKQWCNTYPEDARPTSTSTTTTTTTTTSTTTTTTTTTTVVAPTTTSTAVTSTEGRRRTVSEAGGSSGDVLTGSTPAGRMPVNADQAASTQSQDDLPIVISAVVGVVVVAVSVVVLVVVLRRKQLTSNKAFPHSEKHFHNATISADLGDQRDSTDQRRTTTDTGHYSDPLDSLSSPHYSEDDDDYSEIDTAGADLQHQPQEAAGSKPRGPHPASSHNKPPQQNPNQTSAAVNKAGRVKHGSAHGGKSVSQEQVYAAVNKPRSVSQKEPSQDSSKGPVSKRRQESHVDYYNVTHTADQGWTMQPADQVYAAVHKAHTPDPGVLHTPHQQPTPAPSDQLYAAVHKPRTAHPGPPPTLTEPGDHSPYQNIQHTAPDFHQPSMTLPDQDDDYNSLELGSRRRVVEREEGEGPDHVYSGFNEGDDDTYSEVDGHKRKEVIDDQYAVFQ